MRTVIINRFSPKTVNYEEWLDGIEGEFILICKKEHVDDFSNFFDLKVGFDNFEYNDAIYKYIVDLNNEQKVDYIVAAHEYDLSNAGYLRDYLRISGQNGESALRFRNKLLMKELTKEIINTPNYSRVNNVFDVINFVVQNGYPIVLKPIDKAGSVGVQIVRDEYALLQILEKGIEENFEIESFIDGEMYHVDGLYQNGKLLFAQPAKYINDCFTLLNENKCIGSMMLEKNNPLFNRLCDSVKLILTKFPTPSHAIAFHAEFFYTTSNEIVFCEIASRAAGGMIPETIYHATGVDILKESIRAQCGGSIDYIPKKDLLAGSILVPPKNGTLVSQNPIIPYDWVLEYLKKTENIGKKFNGPNTGSHTIASVIFRGKDENEIMNRYKMLEIWFDNNLVWE
ncbi:ATP-grasp domain-containing protein [Paenibacillus polysaccharolyticus]|uniref:ATP-grasp domain-containing protein n=1 Tax=Paenibacillus polysaccharolyticus TaxID=582692 RepID=A0A1G5E2Z0_9BACL|nr:ATP-grasp domain-containing protein [Paenibacillus polysaccharolyticus]SCY21140.1 ATP-grasp domain-containing protein [Paenibacillus polysaccharolyticus]